MIALFSRHRLALLFSLVAGLIYVSHHFIIPRFLDLKTEEYYPITWQSYPDETLLYLPRAHAVMKGNLIAGDISLSEYHNGPSVLPILNPILLGGFGKVLGSMSKGVIASDFLFPALIFFLLYLLAYETSGRKQWSLVFATLFIFVPKFGIAIPPITLLNLKEFSKVLFPFLNSQEPLYFSQFEEPKLTFLFFVLAVWLFLRATRKGTSRSAVLAGGAFGLLFYTYLYDWATLLVAMGLFSLWSLYQKDFRVVKQILIVVGVGLLVSVGYWYNLIHIVGYKDVILRAGGEFSHHFRFVSVWKSYFRALVLVFGLIALWQKEDHRHLRFIGALLLSYFIVVNAQVITGFNPQPDHWYRVQFLPVALAMWLITLRIYDLFFDPVTEKIRMRGRIVAAFFFLYFFTSIIYGSAVYAVAHAKEYALPLRDTESFGWLETNTKKGSVVGTLSGSKNSELLIHTENNIFLPFGFGTVATDKEIIERAMVLGRFYGLSPEEFGIYLRESVYYLFAEEYGDHSFDANFTHYERKLPDAVEKEKILDYQKYIKNPTNSYRLDYLYFDEREKGLGRDPIVVFPALHKEYDKDGIRIYSFPHNEASH